MKTPATYLQPFIDYARLRQAPVAEILAGIDLPANGPMATLSTADFFTALTSISRYLKEAQLGIQVGRYMQLVHLGVIYQLSLKSSSVEEALFYCHTHLKQTLPLTQFSMESSGETTCITIGLSGQDGLTERVLAEFVLTLVSRELRVITGEPATIVATSPYHDHHYPEGWEPGVTYSVRFVTRQLPSPVKDYKHWGFEVLVPAYVQLMESLRPEISFTNRVKRMALGMANPVLPDLKVLANAFHLTPRTLQRRLSEEDTSFSEIQETLKRAICDLLLHHDRYALLDMAAILGYADAAAFIRAFKKWHGQPPRKLQAREATKAVPAAGRE